MKKLGVISLVFVALISGILFLAPYLVNVDSYRGDIATALNRSINGKIEIGKLSLSLWGHVRVNAAELHINDLEGNPVVSVKDAFFDLPLMSIIKRAPVMQIRLQGAEVRAVKTKSGKMNLLEVFGVSGPPTKSPTAIPQKSGIFSKLVAAAGLNLEVNHARLTYKDLATQGESQFSDLNLAVKDLSLLRPVSGELWGNLDTKTASGWIIQGPARANFLMNTELTASHGPRFKLAVKLNLNELSFLAPGLFAKKPGILANAECVVIGSDTAFRLEQLKAKLVNATLSGTGRFARSDSRIAFNVESQEFDLKPWIEILQKPPGYDLSGVARVKGSAQGVSENLSLAGSAEGKVFGGDFRGTFGGTFQGTAPYRFSMTLNGIDFKNLSETIEGRADVDLNATGSGFSVDEALAHLQGAGKFKISNAVFTTLNIPQVSGEALGKGLAPILQQFPQLREKVGASSRLGAELGSKSHARYKEISSQFTINAGHLKAPDFVAQSDAGQGIDLRGSVDITLANQQVAGRMELIDTHDLARLKNVGINVAGISVEHLLTEGEKPVTLPIQIGCTLKKPCYSYDEVTKKLAEVAIANIRVKAQKGLERKVQDKLTAKLPPALGSDLEKRLKGLFP
ncbi:AsmA-like C-terminal region-containing protein [Bdellovibrionota bacterium FG-2]